MRSSKLVAGAVAAACLLAWSPAWAQHEAAEKAAEQAALTWLALIDQGKNAESWDQAASYFKWTVTKARWDQTLIANRVPLGLVQSRKLAAKKYMVDLPDAIKGEYVVMVFRTAFDNQPKSIENVTAILEKDGKWRICGYNIKQQPK
jgi:hypothetical protein